MSTKLAILWMIISAILLGSTTVFATHIKCGDTITQSTTLDSDIICSGFGSEYALYINTSNVILNCNNHTISLGAGVNDIMSGICVSDYFCYYYGYSSQDTYGVEIKNCTFQGSWSGIVLINTTSSMLVNNTFFSAKTGIALVESSLNLVQNNVIANGRGQYDGIRLGRDSLDYGSENIVANNLLQNLSYIGIDVREDKNTVINNTLKNVTYGIFIYSGVGSHVLKDNIIQDNNLNGGNSGIIIQNVHNTSVKGNKINLVNRTGILINVGSVANRIEENIIENSSSIGLNIYDPSALSANNTLYKNTVCFSGNSDINVSTVIPDNDSGSENTCTTTSNWNDTGTQGCTYVCDNQKPAVLLVHGIYSDDAIWPAMVSSLNQSGFQVFKVGQMSLCNGIPCKGLVPNNGDIWILKNQLKEAIDNVKKKTKQDKISIIAHSMGGLVARAYILGNGYQNDIDKLIMLGTPNEGAPIAETKFASALGFLQGDENADIARQEIIPNSAFLELLNNNNNQKGVIYHAIAGTSIPTLFKDPNTPIIYRLALCRIAPNYCGPNRIITDSIVPESSVNFAGTCAETQVTHADQLGQTYYKNTTVINEVIKLLVNSSTSFQNCQIPFTAPPESIQTQIVQKQNKILPNRTQNSFSKIDLGSTFYTVLNWSTNRMYTEFVSPSNETINATNYRNYPGVEYEFSADSKASIEWFTFSSPEQGNWTVKVKAGNITKAQNYTITLFMNRNVTLQTFADNTTHLPHETAVISAALVDQGLPVLNANVTADVLAPDNNKTRLYLFDDGKHKDGPAQDGVYANTFSNTSQEGYYQTKINATGISNGESFELIDTVPLFVAKYPDLLVRHKDVSFSDDSPHPNQPIKINANITNIGDAPAMNVSIEFYDGDPAENGIVIGIDTILNIPKNKTRQASVIWKASEGAHKIVVFPSSSNTFLDKDYSNEKALAYILVCPDNRTSSTANGTAMNSTQSMNNTRRMLC